MDVYEQLQQSESTETLKLADEKPVSTDSINVKTEEMVQNIENEIGKAYNLIEKQTKSLGSTFGSSFGGFWSNISASINLDDTKQKLNDLNEESVKSLEATKARIGETLGSLQANLPNFNETKTRLEENLSKVEQGLSKLKLNEKKYDEDGNEIKNEMLESLSTKTNQYLDDLDKELETVENFAGKYASKLGSFFSSVISIDDESPSRRSGDFDDDVLVDSDSNILFNVPENVKSQVYATRSEAQLVALNTSADLYTSAINDPNYDSFKKTFKIDSKTEEISTILTKYPPLRSLMSLIVPTKVSYDEFWYRYFFMLDKIEKEEQIRKKLLESNGDNEEDFNWDDDDEASGEKDGKTTQDTEKKDTSRTSSEVTYDLTSANSSTLDIVASKKAKPQPTEDEDDDEDWE